MRNNNSLCCRRKTDTRDTAAGGSRQIGRDGELGIEPTDHRVHYRERGAAARERGALRHAGSGDTGPGARLPGKREAAQKTRGRKLVSSLHYTVRHSQIYLEINP